MVDAAQIERRISAYLKQSDPRLDWRRDAVRKFDFLPLYVGWASVLGIRPDGTLVRWDNEFDPEEIKPLPEAFLRRFALIQGQKSYPELAPLIPPRPNNAVDCATCNGKGSIDAIPDVICECAGFGWVIPGEDRGLALTTITPTSSARRRRSGTRSSMF